LRSLASTGLCVLVMMPVLSVGCASREAGVVHHVEAGENLYRIGLHYGVDARRIARANGIRDTHSLRIGQRLFIPGADRRRRGGIRLPESRRTATGNSTGARSRARPAARHQSSLNFAWPVRGRLSSNFGRRSGRTHDGIDIAAKKGTPIFAAESGRVIHSGRMGGYGKVVIVKHAGAYRSIYAHASRLLVRKGEFVERGQKIAEVGSTGRSTGPHVHFEIRQQETARNPLALLP
jgi:murein DD-endopeptidase MepM/ murein hydrolase activator NlpD